MRVRSGEPVDSGPARDYLTLTKPRIMSLLLLTALCGMFVAARGLPSPLTMLATMAGLALACGGASALNHYMDRDIDVHMRRTDARPVAAGRVPPPRALEFGLTLSAFSFVLLACTTNLLTAVLALVGNLFYVLVYTGYLKRRTAQNIVIGGAAGAVPPLVGYAAVSGNLTLAAALLFLIVFVWTPPHFWALALLIRRDYEAAGVPMLPVVRGEDETTRQILRYTVLMIAVTLLPVALGRRGVGVWDRRRRPGRLLPVAGGQAAPAHDAARRQGALPLLAAVPGAGVRRAGGRLGALAAPRSQNRSACRSGADGGELRTAMARSTTRRPHRAAGSKSARRPRTTPLRSTTPQRKRAPSRASSFEHQGDLIGGSLIALGVFLGFVEYGGWDGGVVGAKLDGLLHLLVGRATAAAPVILAAAGAAVFLRSNLLKVRPLRSGAALAAAAGLLAVSTRSTLNAEHHGGLIGAYLRIALEGLVGPIGVSILIALCALAALVLITGGSIGLSMRWSGRQVAQAASTGAKLSEDVVRKVRERPATRPTLRALPGRDDPENAPLDGKREFADIFGDLPEPEPAAVDEFRVDPEPAAVPEPESAQLALPEEDDTGDVTPALVAPATAPRTPYRLPLGLHPQARPADQRQLAGSREDRPPAARSAGQLRRRGPAGGHGQRAARDPLRAAAGGRHQGQPGVAAARRPGLRAGHHRDPHPGAHPGQAGGRRGGAKQLRQPGHAGRYLRRAAGLARARSPPGWARTSPARA